MDSFAYGATITMRAEFRNPATRELESPDSTPVFTVTRPDGTEQVVPAVEQSEGVFHGQVLPLETEKGVWHYRCDDPDGPGPDPASAESSYFFVRD